MEEGQESGSGALPRLGESSRVRLYRATTPKPRNRGPTHRIRRNSGVRPSGPSRAHRYLPAAPAGRAYAGVRHLTARAQARSERPSQTARSVAPSGTKKRLLPPSASPAARTRQAAVKTRITPSPDGSQTGDGADFIGATATAAAAAVALAQALRRQARHKWQVRPPIGSGYWTESSQTPQIAAIHTRDRAPRSIRSFGSRRRDAGLSAIPKPPCLC